MGKYNNHNISDVSTFCKNYVGGVYEGTIPKIQKSLEMIFLTRLEWMKHYQFIITPLIDIL